MEEKKVQQEQEAVTEEQVQPETSATEATEESTVKEKMEEGEVSSSKEAAEANTESAEQSHTLEDSDALEQIANMKKNEAADMLVEKTRHIVNDAEKQMEACKLLLAEDLKGYDEAKAALKSGALDESEELLTVLGVENEEGDDSDGEVVVFEAKEELPPFIVQEVSSGKFTGFLMALIAGFLTFAGLVYLATEKVGVTLDVTKVPSAETAKQVLGWYATLFGGKPDLFLGGAFVLIVSLLVMWIVYAIRVATKASGNLAFAKQQLSDAEAYVKQKGGCKEEMDKVDAHMQDAIATLKSFEVILHEQNAKLKRILHVEGHKENSEYHDKSREEMQHTRMLVDTIKEFMSIPMSEEGKLSGKSTLFLHSAKSKLQKMIDRLY
jgi:hypothetical protein